MPKPTVLVADDYQFVRTLLKDALVPNGYQVIEAADGNEALERFKADRPDVVLIDLMMPHKSGIEALALGCLRSNPFPGPGRKLPPSVTYERGDGRATNWYPTDCAWRLKNVEAVSESE